MNDIKKELAGALARAYTTDRNSHKELDSILIEDMVTELIPIVERKLKEARIDENKQWLKATKLDYVTSFNFKNRISELEK
jgi:hypothetical protein